MLRYLVAISLGCAFVPAAMAADVPPTGTPVQLAMLSGPSANACLQTPSNLSLTEGRVHQAQCQVAGDAQMYVFDDAALGYRIRTAQGLNCFEAPTGSVDGEPALMSVCNATANQQWQVNYTPGNPNVAMIRNVQAGLCLDVSDGFAKLTTCSFSTGTGPSWLVNPQASRLPGTAYGLRSIHNGQCVDLEGLPETVTCTNDGRSSQRIYANDAAAEVFTLRGSAELTCLLDVDGLATWDQCISGPISQWRLIEHDMGVAPGGEKASHWNVQNVQSGRCLNVGRGGDTEQSLTLWDCDSVPNAQWQFSRY